MPTVDDQLTLDEINAELTQIDQQQGTFISQGVGDSQMTIADIDAELVQIDIGTELESKHDILQQVPEWKDVPLEALKNIPSSAVEFGKNIWQAVRHPIQTGKALGTVGIGGIQKLIPGEQASEQSFDAMVGFFKDRYGGEENLRRTISQDPVGFLNDVSVIFTGGSSVLTKIAPLSKVAKTAANVSKVIDPLAGITKGVSRLASEGVPRVSKSFIKSVIKPQITSKFTPAQKLAKADELATAFITKNLRLKRKSVNRLRAGMDANMENINTIIREGTARGAKTARIDVEGILTSIDNVIDDLDILFKSKKVKANIAQLKKFKEEVRASVRPDLVTGRRLATPEQLQKFKVFQNRKYTPNVETATSALQKVFDDELRKATMNKLQDTFPQIKLINKDTSVMIELERAILNKILQREASPTISVKGLVAGGGGATAGALVGGAEKSVSKLIAQMFAFGVGSVAVERIITSPTVQIKIARVINHLNKALAKTGKLHTVTTPAFQAGRVEREVRTRNPRLAISQAR